MWAKDGSVRDVQLAGARIVLITLSALGFAVLAWLGLRQEYWYWFIPIVFSMVLFAASVILNVISFMRILARMPFRVFEHAVALNHVGVLDGLLRRPIHIPLEMILGAEVVRTKVRGAQVPVIAIGYEMGGGATRRLIVDYSDVEDPLAVIRALRIAVPERMGPVMTSLARQDAPSMEGVPFFVKAEDEPSRHASTPNEVLTFSLPMVGIASFMAIIIGSPWRVLAGLALCSAAVLLAWYLVWLGRRNYAWTWRYGAALEGDAIVLPASALRSILQFYRSRIQLAEVREVRESLGPVFYDRLGTVVMANDEEFLISRSLLDGLASHPAFRREGQVLHNTLPVRGGGRGLVTTRSAGIIGTVLALLAIPSFAIVFGGDIERVFMLEAGLPALASAGMTVALVVIAVLLAFLLSYAYRMYRGKRLRVVGRDLIVPSLLGGSLVIPQEVVLSVERTVRLPATIELFTVMGVVSVSTHASKELTRAGHAPMLIPSKVGIDGGVPRQAVAEEPPSADRGRMVGQETKAQAQRRRLRLLGVGVFLLVAGGGLGFLVTYSSYFTALQDHPARYTLMMALSVGGLSLLALGVIWTYRALRVGPTRVLEKGVETSGAFGVCFERWEDLALFELRTGARGDGRLVLWTRTGDRISLPEGAEGFEEVLRRVHDDLPEAPEGQNRFSFFRERPVRHREDVEVETVGHPARQAGVAFIAVFILLIPITVVGLDASTGFQGPDASPAPWTPDPGPSALAPGRYERQSLNLTGPVTVHRGEALTILNSTLTIGPSDGDRAYLWVEEGATLLLRNSTVGPTTAEEHLDIFIGGRAEVEGCRFERNASRGNYTHGNMVIMVYSDQVRFVDTWVGGSVSLGMYTADASPVVENCTFACRGGEGMECVGGRPSILNSTFYRCWYGASLWHSDATLDGCTFVDGWIGLRIANSSPTVRRCVFIRAMDDSVIITTTSHPRFLGNSFVDSPDDYHIDAPIFNIEFPIALIMPVLSAMILGMGLREEEMAQGRYRELLGTGMVGTAPPSIRPGS
jgi:hypothetical protein